LERLAFNRKKRLDAELSGCGSEMVVFRQVPVPVSWTVAVPDHASVPNGRLAIVVQSETLGDASTVELA
jgi:hypothetical protein